MEIPPRHWDRVGVIPSTLDLVGRTPNRMPALAWDTDARRLARPVGDSWAQVAPDSETVLAIASSTPDSGAESVRAEPVPMGVFVSDDGSLEDLHRLGPISTEMDVPFVLAIVRDRVGQPGYMSLAQLDEMHQMGCELVSHSLSHLHMSYATATRIRREVDESVQWMRDQGWATNHFVYPYGERRIAAERAIGDLCQSACVVSGGVARRPFLRTQIPRHAFGSFFEGGVRTLDAYASLVDEAVRERSMLVFMLHPWSDEHDAEQHSILVDLIHYMREVGMDVVSMTDAWREHGNLWENDIGYGRRIIVDCCGEVWQSRPVAGPADELTRRLVDTPAAGAAIDGLRRIRSLARR